MVLVSDLWHELTGLTDLYQFDGQMLAECPYTHQFGMLGVYAIPKNSDGENAGKLVYLSDAAVEELDAQVHDVGKSLGEVLDA